MKLKKQNKTRELNICIFLQLMADSLCGQHGQLAVRRVGLVPSLEAEPVQILFLPIKDSTALRPSIRR